MLYYFPLVMKRELLLHCFSFVLYVVVLKGASTLIVFSESSGHSASHKYSLEPAGGSPYIGERSGKNLSRALPPTWWTLKEGLQYGLWESIPVVCVCESHNCCAIITVWASQYNKWCNTVFLMCLNRTLCIHYCVNMSLADKFL